MNKGEINTMKRKLTAAVLLAFAAVLASASAASAHVSVNPKTAENGSYTKLTFRVPNERPDAQTIKVEINIPTDKPIASVSVQPQPGWSYVTEKSAFTSPVSAHGTSITEGISKITWTTDANSALKAGEFAEFNISVGPLPADATSLIFRSLQTYSSGEVVRWIEVPADGSEAERPAPVLTLQKASATAAPLEARYEEEDDGPEALSIIAVAASVFAVALSMAALLTGRSRDFRRSNNSPTK